MRHRYRTLVAAWVVGSIASTSASKARGDAASTADPQRIASQVQSDPQVNAPRPSFLDYPQPPIYIDLEWSARSLIFETAGLLAIITYTGFRDWKWGSASFRFNSEHWFGLDTGSGGLDKLGHLYGSYIMSELLYVRLRDQYQRRQVFSIYPAVFTTLLTQYVELFDGYSVDHGYSYEDVIMNTAGIALSFLRNTFPVVAQTFDYRLEYIPSKGGHFHPIIDYEGQKFLGIAKLGGLPIARKTPLQYLELHAGFYARGFRRNDDSFIEKQQTFVFGIGLSLQELIFGPLERYAGVPFDYLALFSNYFQVPYSYHSVVVAERRTPR